MLQCAVSASKGSPSAFRARDHRGSTSCRRERNLWHIFRAMHSLRSERARSPEMPFALKVRLVLSERLLLAGFGLIVVATAVGCGKSITVSTGGSGGSIGSGGMPGDDAGVGDGPVSRGQGGAAGGTTGTSVDCSGVACIANVPSSPMCLSGLCVVSLAAGSIIGSLALDAANVYWAEAGSPYSDGAIKSVPKGGGKPAVLASKQLSARGIAMDATNVYWLTGGLVDGDAAVMSVSKNGGAPTTLASGLSNLNKIAVDATNVYWTSGIIGPSPSGAVMTVPKVGGTPTTLASGGVSIGLVVDAAKVYYTDSSTYTVKSVPKNGGASSVLASNQDRPGDMVMDDTYLYWVNRAAGGSVAKVAKSGVNPRTLASGLDFPQGIAVDATNAYWAMSDAGTVMKVPLEGGVVTTIISDQTSPDDLAVDDSFLYWTTTSNTGTTGIRVTSK